MKIVTLSGKLKSVAKVCHKFAQEYSFARHLRDVPGDKASYLNMTESEPKLESEGREECQIWR